MTVKRGKDKKQRKTKSGWTYADDEYLRANYHNYTNEQLSKALNKSIRNLVQHAKKLGIGNKVEQQKRLTLWDRREAVLDIYRRTQSIVITAKHFKVSYNTIHRLLERVKNEG